MKKFLRKKSPQGFTLIELLVVSTIIVILSAIGLVSFINAGKSARDAKRKADLENVRQALVLRRSDTTNYPDPSGTVAQKFVSLGIILIPDYLTAPLPEDPKNDGTYFYGYSSTGGVDFTLTAVLEKTGPYSIGNP